MPEKLPWRSIPDLARWAAAEYGDAEAVVMSEASERGPSGPAAGQERKTEDVRLTFSQLADAITQAARACVAAGIQPGDHVGIWAPNLPRFEIALIGAQSAGAVVVPLNTRYKGEEAAYILNKSRARL